MTTPDMTAFDLAQQIGFQSAEYDAWRTFVAEWRAAGLPDMNSEAMTPVIKAVEVWAEHLVALRAQQTPEQRAAALLDKHAVYDLVRTTTESEERL